MNRKTCLWALLALAALAGCETFFDFEAEPQPVENIAVRLAPGRSFEGCVVTAAARRRWLAQTLPNGTIRCTLRQRSNLVVVDVVPGDGDKSFSVRPVESNISVRKYDKWVNNLCRDIVNRTSR